MKPSPIARSVTFALASALLFAAAGCGRSALKSQAGPASPPAAATPSDPNATRVRPASPPAAGKDAPDAALEFEAAFFGYDSDALDEAARSALDRAARLLRERSQLRITIEGHCDERGTAEYNLALGERRAQSAREYLSAAGVADERIAVVSLGKERPFDDGHDESSWSRNRRAQIVVR